MGVIQAGGIAQPLSWIWIFLFCASVVAAVFGAAGATDNALLSVQAEGAVCEADVPASSGLWKKSRRTALEKGLL